MPSHELKSEHVTVTLRRTVGTKNDEAAVDYRQSRLVIPIRFAALLLEVLYGVLLEDPPLLEKLYYSDAEVARCGAGMEQRESAQSTLISS